QSFRRVVTGHDSTGKAVFVDDTQSPVETTKGAAVSNFWLHSGKPNNSSNYQDPVAPPVPLEPPVDGSVFRIIELPADPDAIPYVHRTASLDYALVLDGEIYAVLDDDERLMRTGDVLIQRGTNHAWANRSEKPCRMLFVLIDAEPLD
ncbi:MAG: cupin domain-containing protein, partial [Rhodococcus sp.]|nr:cupin domain-containing protein [Rhodococcus sp. (in: high G+C Gram-positive bacteria)]